MTLSRLQSSSSAFQTSFPSSIGGHNVLDVVKQLNNLNTLLQQVGESYKTLLLQNEETTRSSVQFMSDTDHQLSNRIQLK
ncbi:YwqI/YxiC family protein [Peribacillus loiseleuriae]|uniref:YwqI/YxiC family protein n=1 Tax=Peribacillus loiseleuriae TaxID=1679170 RepID=UPI00380C3DEA